MTPQELADLDLAAAKAQALDARIVGSIENDDGPRCLVCGRGEYSPTRDGAEAMRLLEKYRLSLRPHVHPNWRVYDYHAEYESFGPTPAIAICRAVVALKGDTEREAIKAAAPATEKEKPRE